MFFFGIIDSIKMRFGQILVTICNLFLYLLCGVETTFRSFYNFDKIAISCNLLISSNRSVKAFKNGPSKICGRQILKNLKWYSLPRRPYHFKFFNGCLPQVLLGPFLNILTQMIITFLIVPVNTFKSKKPEIRHIVFWIITIGY